VGFLLPRRHVSWHSPSLSTRFLANSDAGARTHGSRLTWGAGSGKSQRSTASQSAYAQFHSTIQRYLCCGTLMREPQVVGSLSIPGQASATPPSPRFGSGSERKQACQSCVFMTCGTNMHRSSLTAEEPCMRCSRSWGTAIHLLRLGMPTFPWMR